MARFAARYKFAGQLDSISILGASEANARAYLLAMRLGLAYSALESLEAIVGKKQIALKDERLAAVAKSERLAKLRYFLSEGSDSKLRNRLELFQTSSSSDLRPVVEALRHTMFHGQFNPSVTGLSSKSSLAFLDSLGMLVFKVIDQEAAKLFADPL